MSGGRGQGAFAGGASELWKRAAQTPDAPALLFEGRSWRYRELASEADALAATLAARGVGEGTVVAALLPNGPAFVRLLHALAALRAVLLPLSWRLTTKELLHPLRDAGAAVLLGEPGEFETPLRGLARALPDVSTSFVRGTGLEVLSDGARSGVSAGARRLPGATVILYTSGTTGEPKGAVLGPEQLEASAEASARLLGASADDRWLACLPLFHIGGLSIPLRCTRAGACVVLHRCFDAPAVADAIDHEGVTQVSLVTTMLAALLDGCGSRPPPPEFRWLLVGGGPVPAPLLERAWRSGWPVATTYGLSEAASQVATRLPEDHEPPFDGRLQPLPGCALRIVDDGDRELEPGAVGEICVRGPQVMRGYLGRERESARVLRGGWLHSGDLGTLDRHGRLRVLDRRDDLIVSGGENVYPAEIEAVLLAHPAVADAGVVGVADARFGTRPQAFWVALESAPHAAEPVPPLEAWCRERLAGFKVPVRFRRVDALPRNASGKLLRRKLHEID